MEPLKMIDESTPIGTEVAEIAIAGSDTGPHLTIYGLEVRK